MHAWGPANPLACACGDTFSDGSCRLFSVCAGETPKPRSVVIDTITAQPLTRRPARLNHMDPLLASVAPAVRVTLRGITPADLWVMDRKDRQRLCHDGKSTNRAESRNEIQTAAIFLRGAPVPLGRSRPSHPVRSDPRRWLCSTTAACPRTAETAPKCLAPSSAVP